MSFVLVEVNCEEGFCGGCLFYHGCICILFDEQVEPFSRPRCSLCLAAEKMVQAYEGLHTAVDGPGQPESDWLDGVYSAMRVIRELKKMEGN